MTDYKPLVDELRKAEDSYADGGLIPVGLIYRLKQAADVIEEQSKENQQLYDMIKKAYLVINSLLPHEEETE